MTTYLGSAPSRRRLASELRRYRFQSSLTVEDVAEALSWSCRKICRIESGRRAASGEDLRRLLAEYHVDDPETAASLIAMACDSEQQRQMAGPVYRRIAEDLRRKIESGELDHGIQLPTELELSREYDVSRHTVRDAVKWLIRCGLVETFPGQGNFVANDIDPPATNHTSELENGIDAESAAHASELAVPSTQVPVISRHTHIQPLGNFKEVFAEVLAAAIQRWVELEEGVAEFCVAESDIDTLRGLLVKEPERQPLLAIQDEVSAFLDCPPAKATCQTLLHEGLDGLLTSFIPSERNSSTPKQLQQLAFLVALTRLRLRQRLAAKVRGSLGSLVSMSFSRQTSPRDRLTRSGQSLRGPTPVSCSSRGTAFVV